MGEVFLVLAFGRNTAEESALKEYLQGFASIWDDIEMIISLRESGFDPGAPNRKLARELEKMANTTRIPIVAQWEILTAVHPVWLETYRDKIVVLWPDESGYFSAHKVILQFKALALGDSVTLVAHHGMIDRLIRMLRKEGVKVPSYFWIEDYDPRSVQLWTRNIWVWTVRETLVKIHHRLKGWM